MPTLMAFSVGTSTADLKTSSPTCTVSGTTITFSVAQTGNIGIGDRVDYDSDNKIGYITARTSQTVWTFRSATGGTPTAAAGVTVNSIKRSFNSAQDAITGATPGWANASHLNAVDLVAADILLDIVAYADGTDTCYVTFDSGAGTVSDATRYIRFYAAGDYPSHGISLAAIANQNNKHNGIIGGTGYLLQASTGNNAIDIQIPRVKVLGISTKRVFTTYAYLYSNITTRFYSAPGPEYTEVAYNLCIDTGSATVFGVMVCGESGYPTVGVNKSIHDNIIISESANNSFGLYAGHLVPNTETIKIYNNTVYGLFGTAGIKLNFYGANAATYCYFKNNVCVNTQSGKPDYQLRTDIYLTPKSGAFTVGETITAPSGASGVVNADNTTRLTVTMDGTVGFAVGDVVTGVTSGQTGTITSIDYGRATANFDYNSSDDGTALTFNHNQTITEANCAFVSTTTSAENLHLQSTSSLIGQGIGPAADSDVSGYDIDQNARSGNSTDIGADLYVNFKAAYMSRSSTIISIFERET